MVTTGEAARALGCTRQWVAQLARDGRLVGMRAGRTWLINADSLDRLRHGVGDADDRPTDHERGDR
ncbi:helix-turn-helix domain-containing protein [Streptomyces sp. NBC_01511]|uniref:helix-turn-helix domain-containing protein n=1 Tax=Streptomyces sp. NBC_01511 TaxID=2903889 RepID=UPI003869608F